MAVRLSCTESFANDDWIYQQLTEGNFYIDQHLEELTDKQWRVFTCTPISNFELKKFQEKFYDALHSHEIKFTDCSVTLVPEFAISNNDDPAIKIELSNISLKQPQIYYALIISRISESAKRKNFTNLPLLLCRGANKLVKSVNDVLQKLFDNSISQRHFSKNEILNFGLLTSLNCDNSISIILKYSYLDIPNTTLSFEIDLENFRELWKSACESVELVSSSDVLSLFYKEIHTHFNKVYGIDLSVFILTSVTIFKNSTFNSNGMIRTKVPESLDFLLRYLTRQTNIINQV